MRAGTGILAPAPRPRRGTLVATPGSDEPVCYMLYLWTDSPEDLGAVSLPGVRFERVTGDGAVPALLGLERAETWFVASASGCSCTLRHVCEESLDLGFGAPEAWYPEDRDEISATKALYDVLERLVAGGFAVTLHDGWCDDAVAPPARTLQVSLSEVSRDRFRLFENTAFRLRP